MGGVLEAATAKFYFCNSDPDTFFKEEGFGDLKNYFCAVEDTVMTTTLKPTNNEWEAEGNTLTYELICPPDRTLKVGEAWCKAVFERRRGFIVYAGYAQIF